MINNDYANSPDLSKMEDHNDKQIDRLASINNKNILYKTSWTLTPDASTIVSMVLPWKPSSLLQLSDTANTDLDNWYKN